MRSWGQLDRSRRAWTLKRQPRHVQRECIVRENLHLFEFARLTERCLTLSVCVQFAEYAALAKERNDKAQARFAAERAELEKQTLAKQRAADLAEKKEREVKRELYAAQERRRIERLKQEREAALNRKKQEEERKKRIEGIAADTASKKLATHKNDAKRQADAEMDDYGEIIQGKRGAGGGGGGGAAAKKRSLNVHNYSTLSREEKRLKDLQNMFGISSSSSSKKGKSRSIHSSSSSSSPAMTDLVKLGTKKRDNRSIEEIERDLRAARMALSGGASSSEQKRREIEATEAQLRRQRAMDAKKVGPISSASSSSPTPTPPTSLDAPSAAADSSHRHRSLTKITGQEQQRPRTSVSPQKVSPEFSVAANFLAGVPSKLPPAPPRSSNSEQKKKGSQEALKRKSGSSDVVETQSKKKSKSASNEKSDAPTPPKRETARDRFLREEAEKKRLNGPSNVASAQQSSAKDKVRGMAPRKVTYDEVSDDDSEAASDMTRDTYESDSEGASSFLSDDDDDDDDRRSKGRSRGRGSGKGKASSSAIGDEIWRIFGKDRSKYVSAGNYDDDEDDMEADAESVFREEMRSAQLAKKEDEREQRELERRAREKAARRARK